MDTYDSNAEQPSTCPLPVDFPGARSTPLAQYQRPITGSCKIYRPVQVILTDSELMKPQQCPPDRENNAMRFSQNAVSTKKTGTQKAPDTKKTGQKPGCGHSDGFLAVV